MYDSCSQTLDIGGLFSSPQQQLTIEFRSLSLIAGCLAARLAPKSLDSTYSHLPERLACVRLVFMRTESTVFDGINSGQFDGTASEVYAMRTLLTCCTDSHAKAGIVTVRSVVSFLKSQDTRFT